VGVVITIHSHHKPVAAFTAPVLCIKAVIGGVDIAEELSGRTAPGTCRPYVVKPAAAPETLVDSMDPRNCSDDVFDVVPAPAEGAGSRCVVSGVIRRVR